MAAPPRTYGPTYKKYKQLFRTEGKYFLINETVWNKLFERVIPTDDDYNDDNSEVEGTTFGNERRKKMTTSVPRVKKIKTVFLI